MLLVGLVTIALLGELVLGICEEILVTLPKLVEVSAHRPLIKQEDARQTDVHPVHNRLYHRSWVFRLPSLHLALAKVGLTPVTHQLAGHIATEVANDSFNGKLVLVGHEDLSKLVELP